MAAAVPGPRRAQELVVEADHLGEVGSEMRSSVPWKRVRSSCRARTGENLKMLADSTRLIIAATYRQAGAVSRRGPSPSAHSPAERQRRGAHGRHDEEPIRAEAAVQRAG